MPAVKKSVSVGVVGSEAAKFTPEGKERCLALIRKLLVGASRVVSGGCHLGGVDIWAEEVASSMEIEMLIFKPRVLTWSASGGFKDRNLEIAKHSVVVHVITVDRLPEGFRGMRFEGCYHCRSDRPLHVKSGGCWTGIQAQKMGKKAFWHIIEN